MTTRTTLTVENLAGKPNSLSIKSMVRFLPRAEAEPLNKKILRFSILANF